MSPGNQIANYTFVYIKQNFKTFYSRLYIIQKLFTILETLHVLYFPITIQIIIQIINWNIKYLSANYVVKLSG